MRQGNVAIKQYKLRIEVPGGEKRVMDVGQWGYVTINRKSQEGDHCVKGE